MASDVVPFLAAKNLRLDPGFFSKQIGGARASLVGKMGCR